MDREKSRWGINFESLSRNRMLANVILLRVAGIRVLCTNESRGRLWSVDSVGVEGDGEGGGRGVGIV